MVTSSALRRARLPHTLVAAAILFACGCEPRGISWLPDSSGFVYTDKKGTRLVQYDVGKKARRLISDQGKRLGHAVSPDGKHFAVAHCETASTAGSRRQTRKVVVAILDREGREQNRSKALEVEEDRIPDEPAAKSAKEDVGALLCWEGHPDRLLTEYGIYDRKADRWIKLPATPAVFNVPGCPPTARGFLAYTAVPIEPGTEAGVPELKVCFVDWDGWASDFKEPVKKSKGEVIGGGWDGRTWRVITTAGVHSFDTVGLKHEFTKAPDKAWEALGQPRRYHRFAGADLVLAAFERKLKPDDYETAHRLELHSPGKQRRKVVYAEGEYLGFNLYPSPNGKLVAVRCFHPGVEGDFVTDVDGGIKYVPRVPPLPPKDVIIVFDDTGEVVATVKPE